MRRLLPFTLFPALLLAGCSLGHVKPATPVGHDSATLRGEVSSNVEGDVTYWFEYGTSDQLGTATPDRTVSFPEGHDANGPKIPVSETITGLQPNTTYHYRMCTSPGAEPGSRGCVTTQEAFTTDQTSVDSTIAEFAAGAPGSNTYVGATGSGTDGEVVLKPTVGEEFDGSGLPSGWQASPWGGGGAVTVSGGTASIDGALLRTTASFGAGRSLELVGSFSGDPFQHLGLGVDFNDDPDWTIFSTGGGALTPSLYARTNNSSQNTEIPGTSSTDPHRYRLVWTTSGVEYFVDGVSVASHTTPATGELGVAGSDFNVGGGATTWNWARLSPYATGGTFTSRVHDSGKAATDWTTLEAQTATPAATGLTIETRSGDTATPDGSWSAWQALGAGGDIASPNARYLQYHAALTTTDDKTTPAVERVTVGYRP